MLHSVVGMNTHESLVQPGSGKYRMISIKNKRIMKMNFYFLYVIK